MSTSHIGRGLLTFIAVLAVPATPVASLSAQPSPGTVRAEALTDRARQLYETPARWSEAALLHQKAAGLHAPEDVEAVRSIEMAAAIFHHAGMHAAAQRAMEKTADAWLSRGDVARAAESFIRAAFIAQGRGRTRDVARLVDSAELLARSPLLSESQRRAIIARITRSTVAIGGNP